MFILGVALTSLIGWLAIGRWLRGGWPAGLGLGFAAGAGLLSLQMLLYGLAHDRWSLAAILLPWLPLAVFRLRRRPAFERPRPPAWLEWIALAAMLAAPVAWLAYERVMPLNTRGWDAWAIWLFKAKAFYLDGNVQTFLRRAGDFTAQPSYPLLIPLQGTFLYLLQGAPADHTIKALSPLYFFALLAAFYYLASRFGPRAPALVFTAMLANLHMVNIVAFELAGYADTALSVYLLLGAGFLYAWIKEDKLEHLILASLFSSLAAWTKDEGLFFLAGVVAIAASRLLRRAVRDWRPWTALLAWPALAVVPWRITLQVFGVPGSGLFQGAWNLSNLGPGLSAILTQAAKPNAYNLTFWLLLASLPLARRAGLDARWWILPALVCWQLAGLLGVYLLGRNEIRWWIGTSLDRILSQVAPLALLASALVAAAWLEARERQTPPRVERRRARKSGSAA